LVYTWFLLHSFTKRGSGWVRDQVSAVICFRVRSPEAAQVGCPEAVHIPDDRPGLAFTDQWGWCRLITWISVFLSRDHSQTVAESARTEPGRARQAESQGRMSIPLLVEWGMSERQARTLVESWELRLAAERPAPAKCTLPHFKTGGNVVKQSKRPNRVKRDKPIRMGE
jgi:hypothetical protein